MSSRFFDTLRCDVFAELVNIHFCSPALDGVWLIQPVVRENIISMSSLSENKKSLSWKLFYISLQTNKPAFMNCDCFQQNVLLVHRLPPLSAEPFSSWLWAKPQPNQVTSQALLKASGFEDCTLSPFCCLWASDIGPLCKSAVDELHVQIHHMFQFCAAGY